MRTVRRILFALVLSVSGLGLVGCADGGPGEGMVDDPPMPLNESAD